MKLLDPNRLWDSWLGLACHTLVAHGRDDVYAQLTSEIGKLAREGEVLDVGCGPGQGPMVLARSYPGLRVVGIDLAPAMVREAESRARKAGVERVSYQAADAMSLPFEDARFDAVYTIDSMKHWPDRVRGLREMHRVLRPGGHPWRWSWTEARATNAVARPRPRRPLRFIPWPATWAMFRTVAGAASFDRAEARSPRELPFRKSRGERPGVDASCW
ncbi:MAG: class I SAM-dependent methyltransferase [Polyangiaceae bacterium]